MEEFSSYIPSNIKDDMQNEPEKTVHEHHSDSSNIKEIEAAIRKASCEEREEEAFYREDEANSDERPLAVIEKDDFKYIGQVLDDKRDGFGICHYKEMKYIGQWRNDMKHGYGKLIFFTGDTYQGEFYNDLLEGYVEQSNECGKMQGICSKGKFTDVVAVQKGSKIYEGTFSDPTRAGTVSFGKLYKASNPKKYFYGEVIDYREEHGFGVFVTENKSVYFGEIKKKIFLNYIEVYTNVGCSFSILTKGVKNGYTFHFYSDSKVSFGKYLDDAKEGPFLSFSNCTNLKANARMELYHCGFRSKAVEKMDAIRKYILLAYPEHRQILHVKYENVINFLNSSIKEEMPYCLKLIADGRYE